MTHMQDQALNADYFSAPIETGDWAGWSKWLTGESFEEHAGPFYSRRGPDGAMMAGFRPGPRNARSGGIVHGGALMTFADYSLFAVASDALAGADAVTLTLNSEFLAPAPLDGLLIGRGRVMRSGKRMIFVQGEIAAGDVAVLAFSGVIAVRR